MELSFLSVFSYFETAVIIAALLPLFTAVILWVHFYSNFDADKMKKIREALRTQADKGAKLSRCRKENLAFMDEASMKTAPSWFYEAWLRMQIQIKQNYQGDYIPDGQSFFDFDTMIEIPGGRSKIDTMWKCFWVLGVIALALPYGVAFIIQSVTGAAIVLGVLVFILLCVGQLIFTLLDQKAYFRAKSEYHRFIETFNKVLPVTKAEVALLVEATQRNREVYENSTQKIVDKFDSITEDTILPALKDSVDVITNGNLIPALQKIETTLDHNLEKTLKLHETGMKKMTETFADHLAYILEAKMAGLGSTIVEVQNSMKALNHDLNIHIKGLTASMQQTIGLQESSMKQTIELQEAGITRIGETFTGTLTGTLETAMGTLSASFNGIEEKMEGLNSRLEASASKLFGLIESQREVLEKSAGILIASGETQEKMLTETNGIQAQVSENGRVLNEHIHMMAGTLDKLTEQTGLFSREAFQFTKDTNEAQLKMAEDVKLSQYKLEAAVNETVAQYKKMHDMNSEMMDNITQRMNDAMINAGKEIASGIKEVTADNAEAIADLSVQAEKLRGDYITYFERFQDSTEKMIEDMDYQVKSIIARITDDVGIMLKESVQANGEILEQYKNNTTDLLQSFDEQARSIGLYAKEINMDVYELTSNLQSSVSEFSSKMQEGVRLTISEFDSGLSELAHRLANTVESISDAVEALPAALNRK